MAFDNLFAPLKVGTKRTRNRIVHVATVSGYGAARKVTDRLITYHGNRAKGGCGMIVTELLNVHPTSLGSPILVSAHDESNLDGFKRWADAVESEDCRLLGQLGHVGRQQLWGPEQIPVSATDKPDGLYWNVAHRLSTDEIPGIVDAYVDAAHRLQRAGFSGVELHGAHGYLIAQFLSPASNDRDDAYGGDRTGRMKFAREIIDGIREACGTDFILGIKLAADEKIPGGIDIDESEAIVRAFAEDGKVDGFAFSQGAFSYTFDAHLPDMHYPPRPFVELHRRLRAAAGGIPAAALGRFESPEAAEQALANGSCDLVGLSRALICDPAWGEKARNGRASDIRPCNFCNLCWAEISFSRPMACFQNPEIATESEVDWRPPPATKRKTVAIVGAGLAGLEAAWIAAERGHDVTVFSASDEVGGSAALEATLPGRAEAQIPIDFQRRKAEAAGARFTLGKKALAEDVLAVSPDEIVIATGARPRPPESLTEPGEAMDLRAACRELGGGTDKRSDTAVIFDQDQSEFVYAAAALFAGRYDRVVLLTPAPDVAREVNLMSRFGVYRRLYDAGVTIERFAEPVRLGGGVMTWRNILTREEFELAEVTCLAYATPRLVNDELVGRLKSSGIPLHVIGDCKLPRNTTAAVHEGHAAGLAI